jgi:hypothetical protein
MPPLSVELEKIVRESMKHFEDYVGPVMMPTVKLMGYMEAFEKEIRWAIEQARSR